MLMSWRGARREWVRAVSSALYLGYFPLASGSFGSLGGFALAWFAHAALLPSLILLSILGFSVCAAAELLYGRKDPSLFVMDEVCGMMLSVLWLPKQFWIYTLAYVIFRILDTVKPWPIRILQNHSHPHSIMWDDLAAGFFTNIIVQITVRFLI